MKGDSSLIFTSLSITPFLSWSTIWANIMTFEGAGSMLEPAPDLSEVVMCDSFSFEKSSTTPVIGGEFEFNNVKFLVMEDGEIYMSVGAIGSMTNVLSDDYMEWKKAHGTTG